MWPGGWRMSGMPFGLQIRDELPFQSSARLRVPLRRAAGERVGPIAKQWEGEVVLRKGGMFPLANAAAHLTLPAQARVPSLSSRDDAGGEGFRGRLCEGEG